MYDPETGRFLSRDPVWDAGNVGGWYTFVGNGPVSGRDPFGDQADAAQEQGYLTRFANWVGGKAEPVVLAPFQFVAWVAGGAKSGGETAVEVVGDLVTDTAVKTMEAKQAADNLVGAAAPLEGAAYGSNPADPQQSNRYYEAQLQQRGRMFAQGGVINENAVELGDKGGRAGFQAGSGGVMFGTSLRKLGKYDIERYGSFNAPSRVGDPWAGHEVLQNAWLKHKGLITDRGVGLSRDNPALAVDKALHAAIGRAQHDLKLFEPDKLLKMSARENIDLNLEALRRAGVPEDVIERIGKAAEEFAREIGALTCERKAK